LASASLLCAGPSDKGRLGAERHRDPSGLAATFLAAAGEPDIKDKLLKGHKVGNMTYKVHIDGLNMLPYLSGEVKGKPQAVLLLHQ
jgi:hypothetical protein